MEKYYIVAVCYDGLAAEPDELSDSRVFNSLDAARWYYDHKVKSCRLDGVDTATLFEAEFKEGILVPTAVLAQSSRFCHSIDHYRECVELDIRTRAREAANGL